MLAGTESVAEPPICSAVPLGSAIGPGGDGCVQAGAGGPIEAVNSRCQARAQGHAAGKCKVVRRAEMATRAAMLISCARLVPVVARAWKVEASTPAARARLNAIAASTSQ